MSSGPATPEMTELHLMEEYHWTPKQISEIPYKKIQKLFLMKNQKGIVENINRVKNQMQSGQNKAARGGKVGYREL